MSLELRPLTFTSNASRTNWGDSYCFSRCHRSKQMEQQVEQKIVKSWAHFTGTRARVVTLAWSVGIASACSSARETNDRLGFSPELDGAAGEEGARGDRGSPGSSTLSMGGEAAEDGGGQDQLGAAGAAGIRTCSSVS